MEDLFHVFPHIAEQIFQNLDNKSLTNCREVSQSWKQLIDDRKLPWTQIIQIPTVLKDGKSYLHLAAETGQTVMFKAIFENEDNKNPMSNSSLQFNWDLRRYVGSWGKTPLHLSSEQGHFEIVKLIAQSSIIFGTDLNEKGGTINGTAFLMACEKGQAKIAEWLIQKSTEFNINLNAKDENGMTAFHLACLKNQTKVAEVLIKNSVEFNINLNTMDKNGLTALHIICIKGHTNTAKLLIQQSAECNIDLNAMTKRGLTAFHLACLGKDPSRYGWHPHTDFC